MLSERNKVTLRSALALLGPLEREAAASAGPIRVLEGFIKCAAEDNELAHPGVVNIIENRQEAEQFLAGLLGLNG